MRDHIPTVTAIAALLFAAGAIVALLDGRTILAGTLFLFTAFSIYVRELHV